MLGEQTGLNGVVIKYSSAKPKLQKFSNIGFVSLTAHFNDRLITF